MCNLHTQEGTLHPWLWSTWVKTSSLKGEDILVASACLPHVNPQLFSELAKGKRVLLACPEREPPTHYGKLASIIRSVKPKTLTVVTVDGSPHCFALQASVNEAEYILGERVKRRHYVVIEGEELVEIKPETIRVARYLHLVDELTRKNPEVLEELERLSLEHSQDLKLRGESRE